MQAPYYKSKPLDVSKPINFYEIQKAFEGYEKVQNEIKEKKDFSGDSTESEEEGTILLRTEAGMSRNAPIQTTESPAVTIAPCSIHPHGFPP